MNKTLLIILIFLSYLLPDLPLITGFESVKAIDLVFLLIFLYLLIEARGKRNESILNHMLKPYFYLLFCSAFISIIVPSIFNNQPLVIADFLILPQIVKYFLIFSIFQSQNIDEKYFYTITKSFIFLGLIVAGVGIFQFYNFFNINNWITPLYRGYDEDFKYVVDGIQIHRRITGVSTNPNFYGFMLVSLFSVNLVLLTKKISIKMKIFSIISLISIIIAVLITISRTAIISAIAVVILYTFVINPSTDIKSKFWIIILGIITFFVFNNYFRTMSFDRRLNYNSESTQTSLSARIRDTQRPFMQSSESIIRFLVGVGPYKTRLRTDSHSDFGWYFQRFGLVGLVIYLLFLNKIFRVMRRNFKQNDDWTKGLNSIGLLFFLTFILFAFASNMFKMIQIMTITFILFGLVFTTNNNLKLNGSNVISPE